jgi:transcriptional regulator GlxA family with amidase domain
MKNISILVLETAVTTSIMDAQYMFSAVNGFFSSSGKEPYFNVKLVGLTKEVKLNNGLVTIHPDLLIKDLKKTDLIIIPAIGQDINEALKKNEEFIPWIINQHKNGSEVASLCIGAFLLASTGLLRNKYCSTHWLFANEFRSRFPDVKLADDKVITEQNGLYSSGGATSYWNLLLYLVEKYTSREMAIIASKYFLLDIEKNTQLPFSMFKGQKEHGDKLILSVQEFIEEHFQEKLTVDEIANRFGLGRRTFERRFKKVTSNTIIEYIQRIKIEIAKKQLENGIKTVNEVMYYVGYNDTKAFREVFKKITGISPVDYRNKYN